MTSVEGAQGPLLKPRMQLDLVHGRDHAGLADDPPKVFGLEVGDADGARPAFLLQLDQRPPALNVEPARGSRPVDQVGVTP